jgi:hypothetical protein
LPRQGISWPTRIAGAPMQQPLDAGYRLKALIYRPF